MKKLVLIFTAIVMIASMTTTVMAQSTKTQEAGALIVSAISLNSTQRLDFGTMSVPTGAVDVVMSTAGATRTATVPANISLIALTAKNATYTVTGTPLYKYTITLPSNSAVKITNGTAAEDMSVVDFTALVGTNTVNGTAGIIGADGTQTFVVGATLKLASSQPAGTYKNNFDVTVTYD